ncbi:MAG: hypothetical protein ACRCX2_16660 [Paraclostridium sp.]
MKNKLSKTISVSLASIALLSNFSYADNLSHDNSILSNDTTISQDSNLSRGSSRPVSFSGNGNNFEGYTRSYVHAGRAYGETIIKSKSGFVSAGAMGAHINYYNSAGKIVVGGSWFYNPNGGALSLTNQLSTNKPGTYHARGTGRAYNGSSYNGRTLNNSPSVTLRSLNISVSEEELKEREYLYDTKNMIAAVGDNDMEGYIVESELYDEENQPNNPTEAIAYMNRMAKMKTRTIPLYANDGETIIGTFTIDCQPSFSVE